MDKYRNRRENFKKLIHQRFKKGPITRASEILNKPASYISRCIWDPEKNQARNIGEVFAREMEKAFGLIEYELDAPIKEKSESNTNTPESDSYIESLLSKATPKSSRQIIKIAQAASEGRLTEADIELISSIAERFEQPKVPNQSAKTIREKL